MENNLKSIIEGIDYARELGFISPILAVFYVRSVIEINIGSERFPLSSEELNNITKNGKVY